MIKPWTSFICVCKTHRFRTCINVAWQTNQPTPWPMPNKKSPLYPENRGNRVEFWNILMLQNYALNSPTQKTQPLGKEMLHGDGNDRPFPLWNPWSCIRKRVGVFTLTMPAVWFAQAPTTIYLCIASRFPARWWGNHHVFANKVECPNPLCSCLVDVPSGYLTVRHGKSQFKFGKSS